MRTHSSSRSRAGVPAAVVLVAVVLAGCTEPAPEPGDAPIPWGHVADFESTPHLEEVLDYDDDLGSDVSLLVVPVADDGFVATTTVDAKAYNAAHDLPVSYWPVEYAEPLVVVIPEGEEAPEFVPPDDVSSFLPYLRRYTSDWELEWEVELVDLLWLPGTDPTVLGWSLLGVPGTDNIGILGNSPSFWGPWPEWAVFQLVTVDEATGEVLSSRADTVLSEGGGYRVAWADSAIAIAAHDPDTENWSLSGYDPADLEEPVWSIPLDEGVKELTAIDDLLLLRAEDGSAVLRHASDGSLVDWAGDFDETTIYRKVGGAIIRSVWREGEFHVMRIDSDGTELWEQEAAVNRWGWPDDQLFFFTRTEGSDAITDARYIDLDTGADVWEKPAAGPFASISGIVGGRVLLENYVPEDEREDPDSRSLLLLDAATGERVLENHIDWLNYYFGENAYYVVSEDAGRRSVIAFGLDSLDPLWTFEVGGDQVFRLGHSLVTMDFEDGVLSYLAP